MARLTLGGVTKRFRDDDAPGGEVVAVDDVSVDIDDGEFLVLVGPSGCGKSTTLRMVAGLESVTTGEVRIGGRDVTDRAAKNRDIAMVFQSYALYPHMTVRRNMAFGLEESTDMPDDEIAATVAETAAMLDIEDLLDRKPRELSGGQQQRVALGRAIVRDPAVFLMDEPLSNLDAKLRAQMRTELQRLQKDLGVTTVYVTHDQTEAMTMGDRIAVLDGGRLQQVGTPLECYHEPANEFVAGFVGDPSMNFVDCEVRGDRLSATAFDYPLVDGLREAVRGVDRVTLGVRPEDVALAGPDGDPTFVAGVDVVEPMGDENVVHLTAGEKTLVATVPGMRRVGAGTEVGVSLPPETVHLFDGQTGEALRNRVVDEDEAERVSL
jgi:carbohydrate ABC transporter ATP-binding protein, CUT1 family (TC 3.A.1.1.-)